MWAELCVNIDHVATLRQARGGRSPDPVAAAAIVERAGAAGITVHLREDRRHIQDRDVDLLARTLTTRMNLEMAATPEMQAVALAIRPRSVCLVPERRQELTTEGGLDAAGDAVRLAGFIRPLIDAGIGVSLFVDPEPIQLRSARQIGADAVEINTGAYSEARTPAETDARAEAIAAAVTLGLSLGLHVNAGHGLDYHNIFRIARIDGIREFNIGHAIVSRAVLCGLDQAVRDMLTCIREA